MLQWWSDEDKEILKELYPETPKNEILNALNSLYRKKTWTAIQKEASRLDISRKLVTSGRPKKKPKQYIGRKQLTDILKTNLTLDEIAVKLKTEVHIIRKFIQKYEL